MKDRVYLEHIFETIEQAEEYIKGLTLHKFMTSPMVQDAVIRKIEVIGEATKNLSSSIRRKFPNYQKLKVKLRIYWLILTGSNGTGGFYSVPVISTGKQTQGSAD
ncbi:MAG: HepT-like ribonuclease domain-containing protein [Desulfocucumaceae bacterium]